MTGIRSQQAGRERGRRLIMTGNTMIYLPGLDWAGLGLLYIKLSGMTRLSRLIYLLAGSLPS